MQSLFPFDHKFEVSCRTINTIIQYVRHKGKDVSVLLRDLPFDEQYLTDTNNWISYELCYQINERLRKMFDDDEIFYKVALAAEKLHTLGFLDYTARLMGDPHFIIKQAPVLNRYFNRTEEIEILKYGPAGAAVKYYPKPGFTPIFDDCYYVKGILASLPNIWGIGPAKIHEKQCCIPIHKKRRMNGKFYSIDEKQNVWEHDVVSDKEGKDTPRLLGPMNADGTFLFQGTLYGADSCVYDVSWSSLKMIFKRLHYDFFIKPKVLMDTIDEMQRENDLIQNKYEELYKSNIEMQRYYVDTINALIRAIDAKDHYTESHSENVSLIAEVVAKKLGLPQDKIETIRRACKLHDLGKIGIKESILLKPNKLSEEEWAEIKKHPILGAEIIKPLTFLSDVAVLIREDHERWDGKGYPDGLKGELIDIGARIIMVSDAYDAMRSGRPYQKAMSQEDAIEEIKRNSGTQFDPQVVDTFLRVIQSLP